MVLIHPDFARCIDLPGTGPCPRPIDIDQARTGFANLVSLRVYAFAQGMVIDGEAEADEVFVVVTRGAAEMVVSHAGHAARPVSLARAGMRVVYMPPHASYRLTAITDCDIAYARVAAVGDVFPPTRGFSVAAERSDMTGYAASMDLALVTARAGTPVRLSQDGGSPERFVHVRSNHALAATIAGQAITDWDTLTLAEGEDASLLVETGSADVLIVSASPRPAGISKVAMIA